MTSHIAQLNIGRFRYPPDGLRMTAFMTCLDCMNALAEQGAGFVCRLRNKSNDASATRIAVADLLAYWRVGHGANSV
jgi:Domain of unknown function (DUF3291)